VVGHKKEPAVKYDPIRIDAETDARRVRRAALRSADQSQRETPGAYIRRCRERANKTPEEVAAKICAHYGAQHHALRDLANLEADQPGDYSRLVRALHAHGAFAFNLPVFYTLAAATCDAGLDDCHAA